MGLAMTALRNVEEALGASRGLAEGKYLEALGSVSTADPAGLASLDGEVRQACDRVRFSPRYAQFLALILFAHWARARREDPAAFLDRLNAFLAAHKPKGETIAPFEVADLQVAAFWMATAAGKTHVLHVCLALLDRPGAWDRVLIVTPSEALTRQHADKLRALAAWEVFAYPMDGDAAALGRRSPDTLIVLDINKLANEKKGDGVTVATSVFADGRNLVFVDEGHKGQKSEESTWKALQADLAGIRAPNPGQRGLLIEFSATFGQVAEGEHAFGRYAKAVILDYAYDRFHRDRYGKDFWHLRVGAQGEASASAQRQTLTAALLAFWHQLACFRSPAGQRARREARLGIAAPLWVLLGLSVIVRRWLGLLDEDALYLELLAWKRTQGWWNFAFDRAAITAALASDRYQILGLPGLMAVSSLADLERLQRLATTLVRRLFEGLYRRRENQRSRFTLVAARESGIPDQYFKEATRGDA